jgi:hypothetical protein
VFEEFGARGVDGQGSGRQKSVAFGSARRHRHGSDARATRSDDVPHGVSESDRVLCGQAGPRQSLPQEIRCGLGPVDHVPVHDQVDERTAVSLREIKLKIAGTRI